MAVSTYWAVTDTPFPEVCESKNSLTEKLHIYFNK